MTNLHMELAGVKDHEDGSATYTFDMTKAMSEECGGLGIKLILYCGIAGISTNEAFDLIIKRGEYLMQEPLLFDLGDE